MKILHLADLHIGCMLGSKRRYAEFEGTFRFLADAIRRHRIEAMLLAGDIFDNGQPSGQAQELYFSFLADAARAGCRDIVITAGNHDSPLFLEAAKPILRPLHIEVIGRPGESVTDEVIALRNPDGTAAAWICAVPYLRERDLRVAARPEESISERRQALAAALVAHYRAVVDAALLQRRAENSEAPIIAMGHFFATGGQTGSTPTDGVAVGALENINLAHLPPEIAYLALGHLHLPQSVGAPHCRYAGSLLAMNFADQPRSRQGWVIDTAHPASPEPLLLPTLQKMARLRGDFDTLTGELDRLVAAGESVWVEAEYEGDAYRANLHQELLRRTADTPVEVLFTRNRKLFSQLAGDPSTVETLDSLTPEAVFARCLKRSDLPPEQTAELLNAFREIAAAIADGATGEELR